MNYHDHLKSIIQAMGVQDNETIQQAGQEYLNLISDLREKFYFIHLDLLISEEEQERIIILVLLGSFFSILINKEIIISEESFQEIQSSLFALFQIESFENQHFEIISNIIFKAARYFKDNWPELPECFIQLFTHSNPYIVSNSIQCLSDCINEKYIDIGPFYENVVLFIQNSLSEPSESFQITIISILRLLYSIIDYIDQEEQNEIFIPIINLIPNYLRQPQNDSIMINDLLLFARYHQNLFSESYHQFFDNLMKIIEDTDLPFEITNSAIYCLFSIIPNYSKHFQSQSCSLFDFFCTKLDEPETYDSAIYSIIFLSEMFGSNIQYSQHLYSFFEDNVPNPISYISFSVSYKRIKNQNNENINSLLNYFGQGFTSELKLIRMKTFQSFWPLIEIFHQSEDEFNYDELTLLLLKVIQSEIDIEVLALEIKMLSKLLKFYAQQLQQNIEEIVKMLDYLLENCKEHKNIIINVIKCYRYISITFNEAKFYTLCQTYNEIMSLTTEKMSDDCWDFFFVCMKSLPCFINSFPEEIFESLMERLFNILFIIYDEKEEDTDSIFVNEKPLIMKLFLRCIQKDAFFNSPEIIEKVKNLAFEVFEEEPKFDKIPLNSDLDLTECCVIFPDNIQNESTVISYEQMEMYKNSMMTIILIFKKFPDLIQFNFESLFKLAEFSLKSILKTSLFIQIFDLEKIISPVIQNEEQLMCLVDKTLDKDIVHEYDQNELKKLSELLFVFLYCSLEKCENNVEIVERIVEFALHVLACLEIENEDKKDDGLILDIDDQGLLNVKIQFVLIIRETFRYCQQFSVNFFDELIFDIINEIQINNDSNKIIATIVFSDFMHFCSDENDKYWNVFFELFNSYLENVNLSVKLSSIYGLSIIATPNKIDVDSVNSLIDVFIQILQNNFNAETCSMVVFAFLQIFQNYSSTFDISIHFQQFWELINGEYFEIPEYCCDYLAQSLIFFGSEFGNLIPEEKIQGLHFIIQKVLDLNKDVSLDEKLKSILLLLNSKNNMES